MKHKCPRKTLPKFRELKENSNLKKNKKQQQLQQQQQLRQKKLCIKPNSKKMLTITCVLKTIAKQMHNCIKGINNNGVQRGDSPQQQL